MRPTAVRAAVVIAMLLSSSCLLLDRLDRVLPGSASGAAVDVAGAPVRATVVVDGSPRVARADEQGAFVVAGLKPGVQALRLTSDSDGDGLAELAAIVSFTLVNDPGRGGVSSVLLGDVVMAGSASLDGTVVDEAGAVVAARVIVVRDLRDLGEDEVRTLSADGVDRSDGAGAFSVRGVPRGDARVFAVSDDGRASVSVAVALVPGPNRLEAPLVLVPVAAPRAVQLVLAEPSSDDVTLQGFEAGVARAEPAFQQQGGRAVSEIAFTAQPGIFDVEVHSGEATGALLEQVIVPTSAVDTGVQRLGLLSLDGLGACDGATLDDRDGDGIPAGEGASTACAAACAGAFADPAATCVIDAGVFDCDDDGDGQPDVTEPPSCRDLCAGGDRDGDGLCDAFDAFPRCADNDAAVCDRDAPFVPPSAFVAPDPCDADIVVAADADFAAIAGCTAVRSLTIRGAVGSLSPMAAIVEATRVALEGLTLSSLDGFNIATADTLTISGLRGATTLTIGRLADVGTLEVTASDATAIALPSLTSATTVNIVDNRSLLSASLPTLATAGSMTFARNGGTSPLDVDLEALTTVEALRFEENGSAAGGGFSDVTIGLTGLTRFGSLTITDNSSGQSTVHLALGAVTDCGDIAIDAPHDVQGPLGPTTSCGDVRAFDTGSTFDVDLLTGITTLRSLVVISDGVAELTALGALRTVSGDLVFAQSVLTGDVTALAGLQSVGGLFQWRSNQGGTLPPMPNLTSVGTLHIEATFLTLGAFPALATLGRLEFADLGSFNAAADAFPLVTALPGGLRIKNVTGDLTALPTLTALGTQILLSDSELSDALLARVIGGAAFSGIDAVVIEALPALTTLAPLSTLTAVNSLALIGLPQVTSLAPLQGVTAVPAALQISNTGVPTVDVNAFAARVAPTDVVTLDNNAP